MSIAGGALTPEFCERGYNIRAAIPEHGDYFARWARESAAVRATADAAIDIRYGSRPMQTLDLFRAGGRQGLLVFIHGGYWRSLDKSDHSFVAKPFVARGIDVAVINYDLCPIVDIGTIVDECRAALRWLLHEGPRHGLATRNVVVAGHSAGGHLTAMLHATDPASLGVDRAAIRGGVAVSGVFDLAPLILTSMNPDLRLNAENSAAWSPVRMRPALDAPLLIAVGANETSEFIRQSQLLWEAWPAVRPAGSAGPVLLDGANHFHAVERLADSDGPLFRDTLALFG